MTQTSNRLLDEFAKLMTDAAGVAQGVRREIETVVKTQGERFLAEMDVVQREEFEAVREMAARAREENEAANRRVEALERRLEALQTRLQPGGSAPAKTGARKRTGSDASPGKDGES
ncbi:MAG TPA: accessory factor UbiK family protein [Propylenella sp.]